MLASAKIDCQMKNDFYSRGRSVSDLKAHLVLTTKYRRKVFTAKMLTRLHEITESLLEKWECRLIEINGEEDHVHILFQYHPAMELSKFVNNFVAEDWQPSVEAKVSS